MAEFEEYISIINDFVGQEVPCSWEIAKYLYLNGHIVNTQEGQYAMAFTEDEVKNAIKEYNSYPINKYSNVNEQALIKLLITANIILPNYPKPKETVQPL